MEKSLFLANRDSFCRINFLYQAAHAVLRENVENRALVRYYISTAKTIAEKCTLRLDPSIKRQLCKKCSLLLVPGVTASVRIKGKKVKRCTVRCIDCDTVKTFPNNAGYRLWCEQPQAWAPPAPSHLPPAAADTGDASSHLQHLKS